MKFNSSPLKSYRNPIGKANVFQPPFFRGELLNIGGVGFLELAILIGDILVYQGSHLKEFYGSMTQ